MSSRKTLRLEQPATFDVAQGDYALMFENSPSTVDSRSSFCSTPAEYFSMDTPFDNELDISSIMSMLDYESTSMFESTAASPVPTEGTSASPTATETPGSNAEAATDSRKKRGRKSPAGDTQTTVSTQLPSNEKKNGSGGLTILPQRRRSQNRENQRAFRKRQIKRIDDLEVKLRDLKAENEYLLSEINLLTGGRPRESFTPVQYGYYDNTVFNSS